MWRHYSTTTTTTTTTNNNNNNNNNNNKASCIYGIFTTKASGDFNGGNKRPMKVLTI